MSKKFKNRVDYIDIAAYGISKVDLVDENINQKKQFEILANK
jgi:hypothetical protein